MRRYDSAAAISAYRTVQEALSNAVKHARATRVTVTLRHAAAKQNGALLIDIADNGKGYDPAQASPGIGSVGVCGRADASTAAPPSPLAMKAPLLPSACRWRADLRQSGARRAGV